MLTKEQRDELRATVASDAQFGGDKLIEWSSQSIADLLDALDEMERERDELRRALNDAALGVTPLPVV